MNSADFVALVVDALEAGSIPYMVVGSFSSNVYGQPRSTKDADFVIELGDRSISEIATRLGADFRLDAQSLFETVTATMCYRIHHQQSAFMIELFLLSTDPHDVARFQRKCLRDVGGRRAYVPTAEDVIVTKVRWSKQGRRQKDVLDVLNILSLRRKTLDLPYIRNWCDQHSTRDLFEQLLLESEQFEQEHP